MRAFFRLFWAIMIDGLYGIREFLAMFRDTGETGKVYTSNMALEAKIEGVTDIKKIIKEATSNELVTEEELKAIIEQHQASRT